MDRLEEGPSTFMGVPAASSVSGGVTILGAPLDGDPDLDRSAPVLGPTAIRAASTAVLRARIDSDLDPLRELSVCDGGDVGASQDDWRRKLAEVTDAVSGVLARSAVPIVLGGDGSVAISMVRALAEELGQGEVAVVHIDAHTDCNPPESDIEQGASAFWIAHAEGLVAPTASVHVALRGPGLNANSVRLCCELGYRTIGMDEIIDRGIMATIDRMHRIVGNRPVYLCWDMDAFDPSVSPGVFSRSWGGIDAATGMRLLRGLSGLRLVAADVNCVNPPADVDGLTAHLAAQLVFELLFSLPRSSA
jgi:arginase family enzyme